MTKFIRVNGVTYNVCNVERIYFEQRHRNSATESSVVDQAVIVFKEKKSRYTDHQDRVKYRTDEIFTEVLAEIEHLRAFVKIETGHAAREENSG